MAPVPVATQVGVLFALFGAGMWASKVAQPLYFESAGQLGAFAVGYAVMAIVGGLSFAWGRLADQLGGLRAVRLGLLLYAAGIAGRVVATLPGAVISSAVAGAGASLVLVAARPWVRSVTSDEQLPHVVATRNAGTQLGVLIGTFGAAAIFALPLTEQTGLRLTLLAAPVVVLLGWGWTLVVARRAPVVPPVVAPAVSKPTTRAPAALVVRLSVIGATSGLYVSLMAPYAPLILTGVGMTASGAALVVGAASLVQFGVSWYLGRRPVRSAYRAFVTSELAAGVVTLAIAAALGMPAAVVVVLYLARAALVSLATIAEELIHYLVIPAAAMGTIFGTTQTAFLTGDALGAVLGARLWQHSGAHALVATAGVLVLVNGALVALLLRSPLPRHEQSDRITVDR